MLSIDIWSDINCPFCYIGKRHLEAALKQVPLAHKLEWKSFELDPVLQPPKGADQTELLAKKYGKSLTWAKEMNANMTEMAKEAGLAFNMDRLVPANTFHAHRLIHLAKSYDKQDAMKERLLKGRFEEGLDIGDNEVLQRLGVEIGLLSDEVKSILASDRFSKEVRDDENMARELGISGVPFFVFNKKYAVSGARPVEDFVELLKKLGNEASA
jgi:predicted DsbA family dithiol-disulfide isomerase